MTDAALSSAPHRGRVGRRDAAEEGLVGDRGHPSHHHRRRWILGGIAVAVAAGIGVFTGLWLESGAHELPLSVAYQRFRPDAPGAKYAHEALRPAQGVYRYTGSG